MKTAAMLCLCLSALALAVSAEEMMMPNATDMGNMTMNMTMNGTEMANDTITDDGRRKLLQLDPVTIVEAVLPREEQLPPQGLDLTDLADLEAEAPAFENEPYPVSGVDFAAGPGGQAAPSADFSEPPMDSLAPMNATGPGMNVTMNDTEMANDTIPAGEQSGSRRALLQTNWKMGGDTGATDADVPVTASDLQEA